MPRPAKWRRVTAIPAVVYFKPAGVPLRELMEVAVSVEEMEAIRLRDVEGLEQEQCARMMAVSRPTFHRVLASARRKIADALTSGKALRIEGGTSLWPTRRFAASLTGTSGNFPSRLWFQDSLFRAPDAAAWMSWLRSPSDAVRVDLVRDRDAIGLAGEAENTVSAVGQRQKTGRQRNQFTKRYQEVANMPFGNRRGPHGLGPKTGRAAGYCSGSPAPGYMNGGAGRFFGGEPVMQVGACVSGSVGEHKDQREDRGENSSSIGR